MIQLTTHFKWFVSSTNVNLCLYFFLPSCSQYLTVYYTFKSKIYPVIKAGEKHFKKVDHLAPVSPISKANPHTIIHMNPLSRNPGSATGSREGTGIFTTMNVIEQSDAVVHVISFSAICDKNLVSLSVSVSTCRHGRP